jgi:aspartate racemase
MMEDMLTASPVFDLRFTTYADRFNAQVDSSPNTLALICGERTLTYRELNESADRLAGYLISLGAKPDMPIGVCVSRSLDMVVAILGIIKAGGAYLPLDPAYPGDRLSFILEDAQAEIVVTQSAFLEMFPKQGMRMIALDRDAQEIDRFPAVQPPTAATVDNLVYVIYTSGSTGKPKGVMITHANLCNFVHVACSVLDVCSDDVYLQSATIAYALSVRQLMVPLLVGATVVIATSEEVGDPLELFKLIKRRNITLMDVVPSFWRSCIQRLSDLPQEEQTCLMDNKLRRIVSIGEALQSDLPREWYDRFGHQVKLVNIFGQTETTGIVAAYPIPQERQSNVGIVPIGRSAARTEIYLLDPNLHPVPDGEAGELCVSNPCLARGYLNRPELTAEKFIRNPFSDGFSDRLYRTGDLARRRPNGDIEFLGRGDHQVKIRGQRLELGEVESSLREHKGVRDCVVMARGDTPDEKYLAAYVVTSSGVQLTSLDLMEFMRERLPHYMIPAVFVFLDALPLNPNGKVNRLALPDPKTVGLNKQFLGGEMTEPRSQVEAAIARIWQDALKVERVGIHDNFFDIGGHSLMAVLVLTRIERTLGVRLPLTSFLHSATIAQLAVLVDGKAEQVHEWSPIVPIQTNGNKPPVFGVHAIEGGVLFWRNIVAGMPKDQPFYAIQAQGVDGVLPVLDSIEDMARLYVREIRKVQPHGPYYLCGFSLGGEIAFEMSQQLHQLGEKVDLLVMLDTRNPARSIRTIQTKDGSIAAASEEQISVSRFEILTRKIRGHSRKLSQLGPSARLSYVWHQIYIRMEHTLVVLLVKMYTLAGKRLPDQLLFLYILKNHTKALTNYAPTLYPGKVTLFRATESLDTNPVDSPLGWEPIAGGGLEVHYFNATHNLVDTEYAEAVSKKLNECILSAGNH